MVIQLFPVTEALSRHLSRLAKNVCTLRKNRKSHRTGGQKSFSFLSDPSPIIVYPCHSLTHSVTFSRLDWLTLACEDANSKLVDVVTVADFDAKKGVDDSLVQIRKLEFRQKINFLFRLWAQDFEGSSGTILKLKFSQYFAADPWLRLWRLFLVEILKLCLVKVLKFSRNADIWLRFWSCCLVCEIMKMKSIQDFFENLWYDRSYFGNQNSTLRSVVPLAMFYERHHFS